MDMYKSLTSRGLAVLSFEGLLVRQYNLCINLSQAVYTSQKFVKPDMIMYE